MGVVRVTNGPSRLTRRGSQESISMPSQLPKPSNQDTDVGFKSANRPSYNWGIKVVVATAKRLYVRGALPKLVSGMTIQTKFGEMSERFLY